MLLVATLTQLSLSSYRQGYQHDGRDFVRGVRHVVWDPHVICGNRSPIVCSFLKVNYVCTRIGIAIQLQAWTGPEGSRRLTLPDFKTIGT